MARRKLRALAQLTLAALVVAAGAHEAPHPYGEWHAAGAVHFQQGDMQNLRCDLQAQELVLDQSVPGVYLPTGVYTSPFYQAPKAFDAATIGFAADLPTESEMVVQVRALGGPGGAKTRWVTVAREGDLALDADYRFLQYRVKLETSNPEASPRFRYFHAVLGHQAGRGPTFSPLGTGNGDVPRPQIVAREDWGARPPKEAYEEHSPEHIVLHHSAVPDQAAYKGDATIRGIQAFHQDGRGWNDIGYHFLIGPEGTIYQGRPETVRGAHVVPNPGKVGICLIGNYQDGDQLTPATREAAVHLMAWLAASFGISPADRIHGHRDWMDTSCPGDQVYQQLDALREDVRKRMQESDDGGAGGDPADPPQDPEDPPPAR